MKHFFVFIFGWLCFAIYNYSDYDAHHSQRSCKNRSVCFFPRKSKECFSVDVGNWIEDNRWQISCFLCKTLHAVAVCYNTSYTDYIFRSEIRKNEKKLEKKKSRWECELWIQLMFSHTGAVWGFCFFYTFRCCSSRCIDKPNQWLGLPWRALQAKE